MPQVLVLHESPTVRAELSQELMAEGFAVHDADSATDAVRILWEGSFVAVLIGDQVSGKSGTALAAELRAITPEIITLDIGREKPARLARRLTALLDGAAAA